jgi:ADP-ribose pyrophosphatase
MKEWKSLYRGKVLKLNLERVRLPNGHVAELEIVHHPGAVAIVPFLDPDHVILIRQYRHAVGDYLYEIPAGKLKKHESPLKCARRELEEEIGYRARRFQKLSSIFTSPGFSDEIIHLFSATHLSKTAQDLEPCEVIESIELPLQEVLQMIRHGKIQDAKSIVALEIAYWWKNNNLLK